MEEKFADLKSRDKRAFMPFVTGADPTVEATIEIVCRLEEAGADAVELGVAYSDPLADGPTIQDAYSRVLGAGLTVDDYFDAVRGIRKRSNIPIASMVSCSIVSRITPAEYCRTAAEAGVDALIVPDLPPEEAGEVMAEGAGRGLGVVFLATPTTPPDRLRTIVNSSKPFVYYVSIVGITGARTSLPPELADGVKAAKALTDTPVVVGFGVSNAETASMVAGYADGVIVGSAIVKVIAANADKSAAEIADAVADFARPIAEAVHA
jgi:tryptophan synthase alpha chain